MALGPTKPASETLLEAAKKEAEAAKAEVSAAADAWEKSKAGQKAKAAGDLLADSGLVVG